MPEKALDVKQTDDSSSSAETSTQDANAGTSMQDFVKNAMQETAPVDKPTEDTTTEEVVDPKEDESSSENEQDTKESDAEKVIETEEKTEGEKEDTKVEEVVEEEEKPVPYQRFKEVNEKATRSEASVKAMQGEVTNYRNITGFCERNNISVKQFNETMELVAALNNGDIEKAAPQIKQWHEQLQNVTGDRLPADIQAKVDDGLDLEVAKQWAKDRARASLVESRGKKTVEQLQSEKLAEFERQTATAADQWVTGKKTADPDFKEGTIKWDEVQDRYQSLLGSRDANGRFTNPVSSAQDMVALLEKAYKDVSDRISKRGNGRPVIKKPLNSNGSSTVSTKTRFEDAKTLPEAVKVGMKERGHTFS